MGEADAPQPHTEDPVARGRYAALCTAPDPDIRGPLSITAVVGVAVASADQRRLVHSAISRGARPRRLQLSGAAHCANDGSNFPWWHWSVEAPWFADVESSRSDLLAAPSDDGTSTMGASPLPNFPLVVTPLALLDAEGRVVVGVLSLGDLVLESDGELELAQWCPSVNAFQWLIRTTFLPDSAARVEHDTRRRTVGLEGHQTHTRPLRARVLVNDDLREVTLAHVDRGTFGLPCGPNRNPNYRHQLVLQGHQFVFMLYVQNNLPNLLGRAIPFRPNREGSNYQEPVGLWFGENPSVGFVSWGRPVNEGTLLIHSLEADETTGHLTALHAELTFVTDAYSSDAGRVVPMLGGVDIDLRRDQLADGRAYLDDTTRIRPRPQIANEADGPVSPP